MVQLSHAEMDSWNENGFAGPFSAVAPAEMAALFEEISQSVLGQLARPPGPGPEARRAHALRVTRNRHLDVPAVARLCAHPEIVERLATLLGPDLVLWRSQVFIQTGSPGRGLPWHCDHYAALLAPPGTNVSVHLALNRATEHNCVRLIPGSHRMGQDELRRRYGLSSAPPINDYGNTRFENSELGDHVARRMLLEPGEFFVFHDKLVHASSENPSPDGSVRIALGIRVTVPEVHVLPAAFSEVPNGEQRCVMLRGIDGLQLNVYDAWACRP